MLVGSVAASWAQQVGGLVCWCVGFVLGCGSFKLGSVCGWLLVADIIFCSEAVVVVCVVGFRCRVWCFWRAVGQGCCWWLRLCGCWQRWLVSWFRGCRSSSCVVGGSVLWQMYQYVVVVVVQVKSSWMGVNDGYACCLTWFFCGFLLKEVPPLPYWWTFYKAMYLCTCRRQRWRYDDGSCCCCNMNLLTDKIWIVKLQLVRSLQLQVII